MNYLGINVGHGASASLMVNGEVIIAAQEERFTKIKNFSGYPKKSIDFILKYLKEKKLKVHIAAFTTIKDKAIYYKYPFNHLFSIKDYQDHYENFFNKKTKKNENYLKKLSGKEDLYLSYNNLSKKKLNSYSHFQKMQKNFLIEQSKNTIDKIIFIDHHTCHAHYAFYSQSEKKKNSAIVTLDSEGDGLNQTVWKYNHKSKEIIKIRSSSTCDLARIYKFITLILKMKPDEHEFKVMGLAPYAKKEYSQIVFEDVFKDLLKVKDMKIEKNKRPKDLYGYLLKKTKPYRFDNIAAATQILLEDTACKLFRQINKKINATNFYLSGGVSMNIKMNKELLDLKFVRNLFVPPTGSDESLSIGACYYLCDKKISKPLENIYLGQEISKINLNNKIKKNFGNKKYKIFKNVKHSKIAKILKNNEPIAVARGREEFGARALGNRSIIASPSNNSVIKKINESIKNRDFWMPFALTILETKHKKYIKNPKNIKSAFMTIGFDTISEKYNKIIAGTHIYDRTVRPQILEQSQNPNYFSLIKEFEKITGVPALLNTSLNLHGNPVSSTLDDVIYTFKNSGLRYLYINDEFLIQK
jgi:carbamoyltransferase